MRLLVVPVLILALAGCAGTSPQESPTTAAPEPSQSAPSETPVASDSPTASEAPEPDAATCENLLDTATVDKGKTMDGKIITFTAEEAEDGGTLKKFLDYGGIACWFGADGSDSPVLYGYGPITDEQAKKEMAHLDKLDTPTGTNEHGGTYYGNSGDTEIYVFSPKGYWAYQYNNGFGTQLGVPDVIEEVVANAPAFY